MSDFRAIGGVSSTLQTLLFDRMEWPDGLVDIPVTVGPPRFATTDVNPVQEDPRVNLFLYRVTENGFLQNQEIPGRGAPGAYGHPPLGLNLHYLVTTYGNEQNTNFGNPGTLFDERLSQFLLGSAMRVLHDSAIITDGLMTVRPPSGRPVLHDSLRGEFERVKLNLEPLSLEDVTKVWTALGLRYRVSAAYVIHVVQVESRRPRRFPQLVGEPPPRIMPQPGDPPVPGPMVVALTMRTPTITEVHVIRSGTGIEQPYPYARIGERLVLLGTNLRGVVTNVAMGALMVPVTNATDTRIEVPIPDAVIPGVGPILPDELLQPGVQPLAVLASDPVIPGSAARSNEAVFMLVPALAAGPPTFIAGPPRRLTINGVRLFRAGRSGETVVGRAVIPQTDYLSATDSAITVPLPDTLPMRDVVVRMSGPLADPAIIGPGPQMMNVTVGATLRTVTANLPASVPRAQLPALLEPVLRDAAPIDPAFQGLRVALYGNRLVVVAPGLISPVTIAPSGGSSAATNLGFTAPNPPGAANAAISGELRPFPTMTAANPGLTVTMGALPPAAVAIVRPRTVAEAAAALEPAIQGASAAAAFTGAMVAALGDQLLVIPGAAVSVSLGPTPIDPASAGELQLLADYAVRVRVNGAESIDGTVVRLPQ
jgi:Pvc16 N-terminal domain